MVISLRFPSIDFAKDSPGPSPSRLRKAGVAASGTEVGSLWKIYVFNIEPTSGGLCRYYLLLHGGIVSEFHAFLKGCGTQLGFQRYK